MAIVTDIMRKLLSFILSLTLRPLLRLLLLPVTLLMPAHMRRMFFMTTLYVRMTGLKDPEADDLKPLVDVLGVATQSSAMVIPAMFARLAWSSVDLERDLELLRTSNRDVAKEICLNIVNKTPGFMLYQRKDDMLSDFLRLFDEVPQQKLLPAPV